MQLTQLIVEQLTSFVVNLKKMLLTELTTKYNNQLDHILGKNKNNVTVFTTAFKNLATDHKAVIRISKSGADTLNDLQQFNHVNMDEDEIVVTKVIPNTVEVKQQQETMFQTGYLEHILIRPDTISTRLVTINVQFKPITAFMEVVINEILYDHHRTLPMVEQFNIPITRNDIKTLEGTNWLNDEIIRFYINMIVTRSRQDDFPDIWAFSTFFTPKLLSNAIKELKDGLCQQSPIFCLSV